MITHIVYWTLKPEAHGKTAAENARIIPEMLQTLIGKVPSLKSLKASATFLSTTTEEINVILVTTHDDAAGLAAYAEHPEHIKVGAYIKEAAASRKAIDFQS